MADLNIMLPKNIGQRPTINGHLSSANGSVLKLAFENEIQMALLKINLKAH